MRYSSSYARMRWVLRHHTVIGSFTGNCLTDKQLMALLRSVAHNVRFDDTGGLWFSVFTRWNGTDYDTDDFFVSWERVG
jgi:hypothetical protein